MRYEVKVRADGRWGTARVGGREFSKAEPVTLAEHEMTEEIRTSALLEVREVRAPRVRKRTTKGAKGGRNDGE